MIEKAFIQNLKNNSNSFAETEPLPKGYIKDSSGNVRKETNREQADRTAQLLVDNLNRNVIKQDEEDRRLRATRKAP